MTIWNTNILINEITAETTPLFKAVKNDDANIFIPLIRYETAYILSPQLSAQADYCHNLQIFLQDNRQ